MHLKSEKFSSYYLQKVQWTPGTILKMLFSLLEIS